MAQSCKAPFKTRNLLNVGDVELLVEVIEDAERTDTVRESFTAFHEHRHVAKSCLVGVVEQNLPLSLCPSLTLKKKPVSFLHNSVKTAEETLG